MARRQDFHCSLLRFAAIALIVNSHMGAIYPVSKLAVGRAIGNAIFFFVSGFSLFLSDRRSFAKWEYRRITRIYPSLWIFMAVSCAFFGFEWNPADIIIPKYWFLKAILIFYPLLYFILKYFENRLPQIIALCLLAMAANLYFFNDFHTAGIVKNTENPTYLHYCIYFPIMLAGALYAKIRRERNAAVPRWTLAIIPLYFAAEIAFGKIFTSLQIIVPIALLAVPIGFERLCMLVPESKVPDSAKKLLAVGGSITLDVYIVQESIIRYFSANILPYYTTIPATFASIAVAAFALYTVSKKASDLLRNAI